MKKIEKIRYEIDPHNRLVYKKTGRESEAPGFRTVLDGEFEIDEDNNVTYHVKKSQGSESPQQVKLKGQWALDNEHNLTLSLDKWGNQIAGNKLTVQSELIGAKGDKLSFTVTSKDSKGNSRIYIVKLYGRWQADEHNRLTFNIEKGKGVTEKITLQGAWEVNPHTKIFGVGVNQQNEIMYTYEKSTPGKKEKINKTIVLKGYWDMVGKHRIIYVLNKEIGSEFDFKVSIGKPVARGLEYELGVGVAPSKKTITLFGEWKVSPKLGLLFEMPCAEGRINRVSFGARGKLDKNLNLEMRLENNVGEDLGIEIKLSRSLLEGQGEAFIRALRSLESVSIAAGIGFRW